MEDEVEWTPNWLLEPIWQNYSSMYREAVSAEGEPRGSRTQVVGMPKVSGLGR